jgi:hypothetical protein
MVRLPGWRADPAPWQAEMLYYNKLRQHRDPMTEHHHHHHPHGHAHPPATVGPSILRLSVAQRLAFAAILTALVWAAAIWAMR